MEGDEIRQHRENLGLTQEAFAERLNAQFSRKYDRAKISRWESGAERVPRNIAAHVLAEITQLAPRGALTPTTELLSNTESASGVLSNKGDAPPAMAALTAVVANRKGGVGKTSLCVNLCAVLARGYRVLLVDTDPQGSATVHLGFDRWELQRNGATLYDVLAKDKPLSEVILHDEQSGIHVAPACEDLAAAQLLIQTDPFNVQKLSDALDTVRHEFDFLVIDSPPDLGALTSSGLVAADLLIIPSQTESASVDAVGAILRDVPKARRMNPNLTVLGIQPMMYRSNQTHDQVCMDKLRTLYKGVPILEAIPRSTYYSQAFDAGRAAVEAMPTVPGAAAYEALAEALMAERARRYGKGEVTDAA